MYHSRRRRVFGAASCDSVDVTNINVAYVWNYAQNYRPITLLPVIYKLFEQILHEKLNAWVISENIKFPSVKQNAYQRHLGALTASFCLQESIFNNIEQTSKVYVATLDTKNAFDTAWLQRVFYNYLN